MHGEVETSYAPRVVGTLLHLVVLAGAAWLLLGGGIETIGAWLGQDWHSGDLPRRAVLFSFGCALWLRMLLTGFWLLRRRLDWSELSGVIFACVVYQLGFALLGVSQTAPLGWLDAAGVALFLLGSWLNTWSEVQRKRFKDNPANQGKLYTGGLFRLARHINYFGDTLWVTGWAMLTHNAWSAIVPVLLTLGFVFVFIPMLSKYLRQRYGRQYDEWTKNSKTFVPFVY